MKRKCRQCGERKVYDDDWKKDEDGPYHHFEWEVFTQRPEKIMQSDGRDFYEFCTAKCARAFANRVKALKPQRRKP